MAFDDLEDKENETSVRQLGRQISDDMVKAGVAQKDAGAVPLGMRILNMGANQIPQSGMPRRALDAGGALSDGAINGLRPNSNADAELQETRPSPEIGQRIVDIGAQQLTPSRSSRPASSSNMADGTSQLTSAPPAAQMNEKSGEAYPGNIVAGDLADWSSGILRDRSYRIFPKTKNTTDPLVGQLKRDEGFRTKPYRDTVGKQTIGYGHNLESHGEKVPTEITQEQAESYLQQDIKTATDELESNLPWTKDLDDARRGVLLNMIFNMGIGSSKEKTGVLGFQQTLDMIKDGNYEGAAEAMRKSKWSKQVGDRAARLAKQMKTGKWQ